MDHITPTWESEAFVKLARLGAIVFLPTSDGKFLMQKNSPGEYNANKLRPPGGGKERKDKGLYDCAVRELHEEFNLDPLTVKKKLKFLGYSHRLKDGHWGTGVFELRNHGLKPGTYQASNDPNEKVTLVESSIAHPDYVGPIPWKLITEEAKEKAEQLVPGVKSASSDKSDTSDVNHVCDRCDVHYTSKQPSAAGTTTETLCPWYEAMTVKKDDSDAMQRGLDAISEDNSFHPNNILTAKERAAFALKHNVTLSMRPDPEPSGKPYDSADGEHYEKYAAEAKGHRFVTESELLAWAANDPKEYDEKLNDCCNHFQKQHKDGVRIKGSCGHMVQNVKCMDELPVETLACPCRSCWKEKHDAGEFKKASDDGKNPYGYCPTCRSGVVQRTRGGKNSKDTCEQGHNYPSRESLATRDAGPTGEVSIPVQQEKPIKWSERLKRLRERRGEDTKEAAFEIVTPADWDIEAGEVIVSEKSASATPTQSTDIPSQSTVLPDLWTDPAITGQPTPGTVPAQVEAGIPRTGPEAIGYALQHLDLAKTEADARDVVRRKLKSKRPLAVKQLGYIQGFQRSGIKPADLMISRVPVIPPQFRPYSVAGDTFIPGDANELYRDLINMVGVHGELQMALGKEGAKANKLRIYDAARAVYGFGEPTSPKTKERGVSGFLQKLVGSNPKHSVIQRKLLSRDMDFVGRGVIGLDPDLGLDEVGIPESMAWRPYGPYIQRRLIRGGMSREGAVMAIRDQTDAARNAMIAEMKERPVMYSRAPSWHKFSCIGGKPKLIKGNTIMINPLVTSGLGADFNGDSVALDYGVVPVLVDGQLLLKDFEHFIAEFVAPGYSADMAISQYGVGTQIFNFAPGRVHVLGIEPDGSPGWVEAGAISIHTSHSDECQRVCSERGLSAVFTSHHNFVKLDANCELKAVKTAEVKVGDLIPTLHKFEIPKLDLTPGISPRPIPDTFDAGFWFGHYLGDGSVTGRADTISQASIDATTLSYLEQAGTEFMTTRPWREGNGFSARWTSRPWVEFVLREIGAGADGKRLPGWMVCRSNAFTYGLIAGFFAAEGNVSASVARIEVVNPTLLVAFQLLLESLGVPTSIHPGKLATSRTQATFVLRSSAAQLRGLGIHWPDIRKCDQFRNMTGISRCPRWNRVPLPEWMKPVLLEQGKKFEGGRGRWKTKTRSASAPDSKQTKMAFIHGYCSREHAFKLIDGYALDEVATQRVQNWLRLVRDLRINWDIITSMQPVERPLVTYDFSIPGMELFVIQGGFLTHNTMTFHVPSLASAVDDVKNKLMPSKMLWSIKDRDKVVPVPKHEAILGTSSAHSRKAKHTYAFPDEATALAALKRGEISPSDELQIGNQMQ